MNVQETLAHTITKEGMKGSGLGLPKICLLRNVVFLEKRVIPCDVAIPARGTCGAVLAKWST